MRWLQTKTSPSERSAQDRSQDERRRAEDTLALAKIEPHHTVLEIEPGKGWFTGLLLERISGDGALIVQQPKSLEAFFGKEARKRVARSSHTSAHYSDDGWESLSAPEGSVDRVVWIQGPHELWFRPKPGVSFGQPSRVFAEIVRVLKPEGALLIVDNLAPDGVNADVAGQLHRSVPEILIELSAAVGLIPVRNERDWIKSEVDPLTLPTFDPTVHLQTAQFAQLYKKVS